MRSFWRSAGLGVLVVLAAGLGACGGDSKKSQPTPDVTADSNADVIPGEVQEDIPGRIDLLPQDVPGDAADVAGDVQDDGVQDTTDVTEEIVEPPLPELPTQQPLPVPQDPLAGTEVKPCATYLEDRCEGAHKVRCEIYDTVSGTFVADPDPMLERAYLFDRWRDLYNSPDGQAIDRDFIGEVLPGTPESVWGDPAQFEGYWGTGDGGIWTGWSVVAAILRYSQTGTQADYERMEEQVRDMVTMYDVTGVPGYLCRYHFLLVPDGTPNTPDHILRWEGSFTADHRDRVIPNPENIPNLPEIYTQGVPDGSGGFIKGTPMWRGRPSIDQNTGPMTSLPMAYGLLKDEELKGKISHHLTCYLKRLQRIEIINLQKNQELLNGLIAYFSVGELKLDEGDIDLTKLDRIVGYVQRQVNSKNEATFDYSCPDGVQYEPWRVIDATSPTFLKDLLDLVSDMDDGGFRPNTIDHYYWPSIRGGDAMHLMHLATMAYYMTGEEQYREFLFKELIGNINALEVVHTAGAFDLPKFCKKYYGDQITFGPWWAFLHLLADSELRTELMKAYHNEFWLKLIKQVGNVDFNIMYAGALPDEIATEKQQALAYAMEQLPWMGGNGGLHMGTPEDTSWLQDPRRSYTNTPDAILANTPDGITAVCPTQQEIDICNAQIEILGIKMDNLTGWSTHTCNPSDPYECVVFDDKCVQKQASGPLPVHLRNYTDYLWQRNAFALGSGAGVQGKRQYAGSDYSVPYWNAVRYGFITETAGQVLAWHETGPCGPQ